MTRYEYEETKAELEIRLEELKKELEELEKEEIVEKRWKLSRNEVYYCVDEIGRVESHCYDDDEYDEWACLTNNCFKTEEEAEEYKKKLETYYKFKNYVEEHNDEIDWKDDEQQKHYLYGEYYNENHCFEFGFGLDYTRKHQGVIYATSKEILLDAIEYVGEDNVKKYILEVE